MSDGEATFAGVTGTVSVGTERALTGSVAEGALTLPAWSGAVVVR
jgi:hypothetical protein